MTPTPLPSPPLISEDAFVATPEMFLMSLKPEFRRPLCVYTLRLAAFLRLNSPGDGEMLKALAQIEGIVTSSLQAASKEPELRSGYAPV